MNNRKLPSQTERVVVDSVTVGCVWIALIGFALMYWSVMVLVTLKIFGVI